LKPTGIVLQTEGLDDSIATKGTSYLQDKVSSFTQGFDHDLEISDVDGHDDDGDGGDGDGGRGGGRTHQLYGGKGTFDMGGGAGKDNPRVGGGGSSSSSTQDTIQRPQQANKYREGVVT